jgi:hypothetical protein
VELRTREVLKDSRFLIVLSAQSQPSLAKQRHVHSQSLGKTCGQREGRDQNSSHTTHVQDVLRQSVRYNDRDIGPRSLFVLNQFIDPFVAPIPDSLGFPQELFRNLT